MLRKIVIKFILIIIVFTGCLVLFINSITSAPTYQGDVSDHFNGNEFHNSINSEKTPWDIIKLFARYPFYKEPWPVWLDNDSAIASKVEERSQTLRVTFINHSSFLVQIDGVNILTDPVFAERASPVSWAGPKRVRAPGVTFNSLPPIDVVLISHNHYDHLDIEALKALYRRQQGDEPLILAGLGNSGLLAEQGVGKFRDLDWGDTVNIGDVGFTFVESRHRSGRGISDQMKTLWGSFVIQSSKGPIYFAGDTGYGPHFKSAYNQFGAFYLSLLPIGAYEPRWFMKDIHLNPEEAVKAHLDLRSSNSVGMHFGTFQLTHESINRPVDDLSVALSKHQVKNEQFKVLEFGETREYK